MIWFKKCSKCHGDLIELLDGYGKYIACIQCSYTPTELEERHLRTYGTLKLAEASRRSAEGEKKPRVA